MACGSSSASRSSTGANGGGLWSPDVISTGPPNLANAASSTPAAILVAALVQERRRVVDHHPTHTLGQPDPTAGTKRHLLHEQLRRAGVVLRLDPPQDLGQRPVLHLGDRGGFRAALPEQRPHRRLVDDDAAQQVWPGGGELEGDHRPGGVADH
jgi:hypothetical protein